MEVNIEEVSPLTTCLLTPRLLFHVACLMVMKLLLQFPATMQHAFAMPACHAMLLHVLLFVFKLCHMQCC